jgi:hypothetical protein
MAPARFEIEYGEQPEGAQWGRGEGLWMVGGVFLGAP